MKHRLFWKFLLAFWGALLMVAALAVLGGQLLEQHYGQPREDQVLESGPRAVRVLDAAQAVFWSGGEEALRMLLRTDSWSRHNLVYVVDEAGHELLGRRLPAASLVAARQLAAGMPVRTGQAFEGSSLLQRARAPFSAEGRGARRAVRKLQGADGRVWLLFVPEDHQGRGFPDRPPAHISMADGLPDELPMDTSGEMFPPPPPLGHPPPEHAGWHKAAEADAADAGPGAQHPGRAAPQARPGPPAPAAPPPPGTANDPRHGPQGGPSGRPPQPWLPELDSRTARSLLMGAAVLGSFLFAAWLAWSLTRPVRTLRQALDAAAAGHLDTRVSGRMGRGRNEITDLGQHFDHMIAQIQQLLTSRQRLLHDVSHELRSPLARLQAASDLARQNPARLQDSLDRIDRETARLDHLIDQALTLARLEGGPSDEAPECFDLAAMVQEIVADAGFEADARQVQVQLAREGQRDGPVEVCLREELIYRACENVIRNAIKFSAPGTVVEVKLLVPALPAGVPGPVSDAGGQDGWVAVQVLDRGPGVPAGQLAQIFSPFFRARGSSGVDGYGLGLAIVQQAVQQHGGQVGARARDGGGLVVELRLPRQWSASPSAG